MSVVVVNPMNGKYLDQKRGQNRGETDDLSKAQVFETEGKAKVGYNHAWARSRSYNRYFHERVRQQLPMGSMMLKDIPEFQTRPVKVVLDIES